MSSSADVSPHSYVFGHSERELERLARQARLVDPITRRIFLQAGIASGMRVLDVGSGAGDVAFIAADLVGQSGEVIGTDRSAGAVATARARADALGLKNVSFREGDPAEMNFDKPFDAALGRYVLEFQPDPSAMLRKISRHVRPGGLIVFHEPDAVTESSFPPAPTHDRSWALFVEALRGTGANPRMGLHLYRAFTEAGLPPPAQRLEAIVAGGPMAEDYLRSAADILASVAGDVERLGLATAAELGVETLAQRMIDEVIANGSVIIGRSEVGAWSRV